MAQGLTSDSLKILKMGPTFQAGVCARQCTCKTTVLSTRICLLSSYMCIAAHNVKNYPMSFKQISRLTRALPHTQYLNLSNVLQTKQTNQSSYMCIAAHKLLLETFVPFSEFLDCPRLTLGPTGAKFSCWLKYSESKKYGAVLREKSYRYTSP